MAISVRDIQEMEFSTQSANGYKVEEVDDFLDAIAEQMSALVRENLALSTQNKNLLKNLEGAKADATAAKAEIAAANAKTQAIQAEADAAKKELEEMKSSPSYGDANYFKNLQVAIRESLVSSQRIADETVAEARRQADQVVQDAHVQAAHIIADADHDVKISKDELAKLRNAIEAYRAGFRKLLADQIQVLKEEMPTID